MGWVGSMCRRERRSGSRFQCLRAQGQPVSTTETVIALTLPILPLRAPSCRPSRKATTPARCRPSLAPATASGPRRARTRALHAARLSVCPSLAASGVSKERLRDKLLACTPSYPQLARRLIGRSCRACKLTDTVQNSGQASQFALILRRHATPAPRPRSTLMRVYRTAQGSGRVGTGCVGTDITLDRNGDVSRAIRGS